MSEDRLEKAVEAMKSENASPEQLAGARARVWANLGNAGAAACAEFRTGFPEYLDGRLAGNRRLLMEDHLSRCVPCRTQLAALKGGATVVAMPDRRVSSWPQWRTWAIAAALLVAALYLGRDRLDTLMAPQGPRATVASVEGGFYGVVEGVIQNGATIREGQVVRTGPGARAVLRLADGSVIDVNERSELFVRAAWSGQTVYLQRGDIIVRAAKQRRGHLRVETRDSVASVRGTVFAVSSGMGGTLVSVVEGSVAVSQPGGDVVLSPGEQAASNPALTNSVQDAVSWSPDAESYTALLGSLAKIDKQMAALPIPALRTQSRLLSMLPVNALVYGAVPNLDGIIGETVGLVEQQSAENPVFRSWWSSSAGQELRLVLDRIQTVTPLLGDEIIFTISAGAPGTSEEFPMVLAEIQPGKSAELAKALDALAAQTGNASLPYSLTDTLMVISNSSANLRRAIGYMGQGAASPFAAAIASRYQRGVGWLLGMDLEQRFAQASGAAGFQLTGAQQMKHLFLEQRTLQGIEQNEVTLTFQGPRTGIASWLANSGSGGAAEYISSDAVIAGYVATREPRQLFEELAAQLAKVAPSATGELGAAETRLGTGFIQNLVASFGTESAFALEGISVTGPVWVLTCLVNDAPTLEGSIRKLVDLGNAELAKVDPSRQITLTQETVDGRTWTTMKSGTFPLSVTWTFDRGYLVAASDRGTAARAIATRNGGSPLVWSSAFQQQLPAAAGLHPAAFVWLNTKGAFEGLAALLPNPALKQLIGERDPVLVALDGTVEQIHAASRIRLSGLLVDVMLLESLSRVRSGPINPLFSQGSVQPGIR